MDEANSTGSWITTLWPKVHVVHCGVGFDVYRRLSSALSSAQRLVCVGRLCEQKGQLLLIEAAHRLTAEGTDFELVLAGDGELRAGIEASISHYRLQDKVRITGWISNDQVRKEILAARALVLPSFAEGLPVVLMEAMALRRPVISTYVAGIPELVHSRRARLACAGRRCRCIDQGPTNLSRRTGRSTRTNG